MRWYRPECYDATVVFLTPEGPRERVFRLEERLLGDAAIFLEHLEDMRLAAGDLEAFNQARNAAILHCLFKPIDQGGPVAADDLDYLTPSVVQSLLDDQSDLYGYKGEDEKLGKKFRPLLDLMWRHAAAVSAENHRGMRPSISVHPPMESTLPESGQPGHTDS